MNSSPYFRLVVISTIIQYFEHKHKCFSPFRLFVWLFVFVFFLNMKDFFKSDLCFQLVKLDVYWLGCRNDYFAELSAIK